MRDASPAFGMTGTNIQKDLFGIFPLLNVTIERSGGAKRNIRFERHG
jgi:hypothetical protein